MNKSKIENKAQVEEILKHRFFLSPTGYPSQNGFIDYGPPLAQIKQQIINEYKKVFVDEYVYEMEPSAMLPYEVLKSSGHIDKFCDVILTDGESIVRADHYIEEKIGEILNIPSDLSENYASIIEKVEILKHDIIMMKMLKSQKISQPQAKEILNSEASILQFTQNEVSSILSEFNCIEKRLSDFDKKEIDFIVILHNLHSPNNKPFNPSKDFNLIFKLNDRQFLRPELAQCMFTNFRKLYEMNYEKLPFASLTIGRSYRNEISARGGMLRTKEFEQAEIEYFTENGKHEGFESIKDVEILILPNTSKLSFRIKISEAFEKKIISSEAICYYIAKSQEFLLNIGFSLESLRFRQHNLNEMAHYANDCWDVEIKTLSGWVECAGIADRASYDLTVHSKAVNAQVKRLLDKPKIKYELSLDKATLGKTLKSRFKELEDLVNGLPQEYIQKNKKEGIIKIKFDGKEYEASVTEKLLDYEFFIPQVIEPSFGISRVLYALVEQGMCIRDDRNVLKLKPKMCFMQCVISYISEKQEFKPWILKLKQEFKLRSIRFSVNERSCSIGKKYSSCDEIGVPFFITFDSESVNDKKVTIRERDSMKQIRVSIEEVPEIIEELIKERKDWEHFLKTKAAFN